jgi:hypothetical protein
MYAYGLGFLLSCLPAGALLPQASSPGGSTGETRPQKAWAPIGRLEHAQISECSGIVASRKYPGIYWVHNDSGHDASLFAVKESGELVAHVRLREAPNTDWEDIAADDQGHLFIGDIGNNVGLFPVRYVYEIEEPDPYAERASPPEVLRRIKYSMPDGRANVEAMYVRQGQIYLIARTPTRKARVLRLEETESGTARAVEFAEVPARDVTGADLSADGRRLVVCTSTGVSVLELDSEGQPRTDEPAQTVDYPVDSVEACCFDGDAVLVASEGREIFRITASDLRDGVWFRHKKHLKKPAAGE